MDLEEGYSRVQGNIKILNVYEKGKWKSVRTKRTKKQIKVYKKWQN